MQGAQSIEVKAPPEQVYAAVSDVTRMGEVSPECHKVEWLGGASGPSPGTRFVGHNKANGISWSREGRIVSAEPGHSFSFAIEWRGHDSTVWTYTMTPTNDGTLLTESYEVLWAPWWMNAMNKVTLRGSNLEKNMSKTLAALKKVIEG